MADPKFYESMPETLPETLPVGTRCNASRWVLSVPAVLKPHPYGGQCYFGKYHDEGGVEQDATRNGVCRPVSVDWKTVPIQPQAPAEPPCAACGASREATRERWAVLSRGESHLTCERCAKDDREVTLAAIRSRKATPQDSSFAAHEGPMAVVLDGHGNTDTVPACSTPACAARSVVATHGQHCVYCSHEFTFRSGRKAEKREHATLDSMHEGPDVEPRNVAARARMDAADRRERPRFNHAERKMLTAGHPSTWPSNEGEE